MNQPFHGEYFAVQTIYVYIVLHPLYIIGNSKLYRRMPFSEMLTPRGSCKNRRFGRTYLSYVPELRPRTRDVLHQK
jgi:hypothetical protein